MAENHSALKVLLVSSEVSPFAKSGGLGDVIGSLPRALRVKGVDARVVFPKYKNIKQAFNQTAKYIDSFYVSLGWRNQSASVYTFDYDFPVYGIENEYYFNRDSFYGYGDDFERFAFFSKAAIEFLGTIDDFKPDVIHFNDWQTGPACIYLKDYYSRYTFYSKMKSLFTIHNIQYQGIFGREVLGTIDLNDGYCTNDKMEFHNNISFMKAGLTYADCISTVSETYAREIQGPGFGYGLDGLLRARSNSLYGIVNGIDYEKYDPETDPYIFRNYNYSRIHLKDANKKALQELLKLPKKNVPVVGIISRLADQKGFDVIAVALEELLSLDVQIVILGTGEGRYEHLFKNAAWRHPDKMSANITFNEDLAQKIYAGSDFFLMPSLFEPCGLGQLFAMRYGTIPIVRETGGLSDTVKHYNEDTKEGNGFVFRDYDAKGMMWAFREALRLYGQKSDWFQIVENAMSSDFSWEKSAEKYIDLYTKMARS